MQNPAYTGPSDEINAKYRRKYRRLKRIMKDLVFENAAFCDQAAQIQENINQVKEERRYLLKKLLEHENEMETQLGRPCSKLNELIANSLPPKRQYKKREKNPIATANSNTGEVNVATPVAADGTVNASPEEVGKETSAKAAGKPTVGRKVRANQANLKKIQNFSLNQSGHPTYPIMVGGFTIYNLGEIASERPSYNTEYTIYPVGYTVTRPYGHLKDPEKKCVYTCRVVDNGEAPRFEIIPESDAELTISGSTTDLCHEMLLQRINGSLSIRSIKTRPSGDWFFGLSHPTISSLIQSFPSSKKCMNYKGIKKENFTNMDKENDPTLNYDALLRHITISTYHTVPEIKEEPPDELFDHSEGNSPFGKLT